MDVSLLANIFRGGARQPVTVEQEEEEDEESTGISGCSQDGVNVMVFLVLFFFISDTYI